MSLEKIETHKSEKNTYKVSGKPTRGQQLSKSTKTSWTNCEEDLLRYEFFLNNSEMENNTHVFTEKESIVIELVNNDIFSLEDKQKLAMNLKEIVLEPFISNTFTDNEDIKETYFLILDELEKTGMKYSLDINNPLKAFPIAINKIPKSAFYYSLTCSYKIKDSNPSTYIAEKVKTDIDFCIETNKVYNNRFFDTYEDPDRIHLNIWNKNIKGQDEMKKKILYPIYKKTGDTNKEFTDVMDILQNSEFNKLENKYYINKWFF